MRAENLERITGATVYSAARVFIEALEGAEVDLSNVTDIVVTQSSSRWRSVEVKAEGNGSVVGLNNLQTFYDEWGNGEGAYSRLDATNGAAINLGNLTNVSGVLLPMDGTGTLNTSTITSFDDCRLEASGAAVDLSKVPNVENTHFVIDGVDVDLESLTSATNSSFEINGYDINLDGLDQRRRNDLSRVGASRDRSSRRQ